MDVLLDSTVIIHLLRRRQKAVGWINDNRDILGITSTTWMEAMEGATSKQNQTYCKQTLSQFSLVFPIITDHQWAMEKLETYQFSHHIGMNDCLIAAVAFRLNIPLYTHNLKDMSPLLGSLAQKPY
ncbi:MAG: PIN domain-containing protein [Chloroflexota bacterium]